AKGLVACYLMNEGTGTILNDLSKNGNTGTISNGTWVASEYGGGLEFNALNSEVLITDNSTIDLLNNVTFEALVYPRSEGVQRLFHKNLAYGVSMYNTDYRVFLWNYNGGQQSISTNGLTPDAINHLIITKSVDGVFFFIDCEDAGSDTATGAKKDLRTSLVDLFIGLDEDGSSFPFDGSILLFLMYNRVLSATEIYNHYKDPYDMFI
ncbi:MAG: LamG-like jellyroll fold domain-containing protein, partial [Halobacteriota archaeon]|nr:LamG-like jellyroll fold domain-containing protein [Halobacteriota archaeon]